MEKDVFTPGIVIDVISRAVFRQSVVFFKSWFESRVCGVFTVNWQFFRSSIRSLEFTRQNEDIQITIPVVVGEGGIQAGIGNIESPFLSTFLELDGSSRLRDINVETVGRIVITEINIEVAVIIDIKNGSPAGPKFAKFRVPGNLFELPRTHLAEDFTGPGSGC